MFSCRQPLRNNQAEDRIRLVTTNAVSQVRDVLKEHLEEILSNHAKAHYGNFYSSFLNFAGGASPSSLHAYAAYEEAIETRQEFEQGEIFLLLSVGSDGFRPKRVSR